MQRTRWQTLLTVAATTAALGWLVLRLLDRAGVEPPPVPLLVCLVMLVIAGVVFTMGWQVRQFLGGRRPLLNPIRAARTAVLAKASCYTGALLTGWYLSQVLAVLGDLSITSQRDRALAAGVAAVTAILMAAVGLLVEWFCRVPPPAEPEKEPPGPEQAAR